MIKSVPVDQVRTNVQVVPRSLQFSLELEPSETFFQIWFKQDPVKPRVGDYIPCTLEIHLLRLANPGKFLVDLEWTDKDWIIQGKHRMNLEFNEIGTKTIQLLLIPLRAGSLRVPLVRVENAFFEYMDVAKQLQVFPVMESRRVEIKEESSVEFGFGGRIVQVIQ
jgi:hypothetical protein